MTRRETKPLPLLLLIALTSALPAARAARAADTVPIPLPAEPARIRIVPHLDPAGRARRVAEEESRRAALRPAVDLWCRAYTAAVRPLRAALDETWDSLERGWGPASRNLGYPVHQALRPIAALPPLPEPGLDRQLRQALFYIEEGAAACSKGMPMTALLRLAAGRQDLGEVESRLATYSGGCAFPAPPGFTVVLGQEVGDPYASGGTAEPAATKEAAPPRSGGRERAATERSAKGVSGQRRRKKEPTR
jgi:hypothetical protein